MNKNFLLILAFVASTLAIQCSAAFQYEQEYTKIRALSCLESELAHLNEQSLVVFDVDDTLVEGSATMNEQAYEEYKKVFAVLWKSPYGPQAHHLIQKKLNKMVPRLIESNSPSIVRRLRQSNVKVITLTSIPKRLKTDTCVLSLIQFREETLRALGFDFASSFTGHTCHLLPLLGDKDDHPIYYEGNLFSQPCKKGAVLKAFLDFIQWRPQKLIFVDNDKYCVLDVLETARSMNLECLGVIYKGAQHLPPFDVNLFKFRIEHLLKFDTWLSQDEAHELVYTAT